MSSAGSVLGKMPGPAVSHTGLSSPLRATFNLTKAMIGAGVFSLPKGILDSGPAQTIIIMILVELLMYWSSMSLIKGANKHNAPTYSTTLKKLLGRFGGYSESLFTFLLTFGALLSYMILVANSLTTSLVSITGWKSSCLKDPSTCEDKSSVNFARIFLDRRVVTTILGFLIMLPLMILPNVHFLSYSSVFGIICFLFIAICLSERAYTMPEKYRGTMSTKDVYTNTHISNIIGMASRALFISVCQHAQFTIFNSLKNNTSRNRGIVLISSIVTNTVTSMIFAMIMYVTINNKIKGDIFQSFPDDDILITICRLALSLHITCTYPLQGHICRDGIIEVIHGVKARRRKITAALYGALVFGSTWVLSLFVCDFGAAVDLTGGVAASCLSLILPALCAISLARGEKESLKSYIMPAIAIIFGLIVFVITIIGAFQKGFAGGSEECTNVYIGT